MGGIKWVYGIPTSLLITSKNSKLTFWKFYLFMKKIGNWKGLMITSIEFDSIEVYHIGEGYCRGRMLQSILDALFFSNPGFKIGPQVVMGMIDIQFPPDISPVGFDSVERNMQMFGYCYAC